MKAPIEFLQIGLDPNRFVQSDKNKTWRGPCPNCGGTRRFLMFTDHPWPLQNGQCDLCGYQIKAWQKVRVSVDPHVLAAREAEMAREAAEKAERRREKLADFTTHEIWTEFNERMQEEQVKWWDSQGVPEEIQRLNKLGYNPEKIYRSGDQVFKSPAYTIPYFGLGWNFLTMQYRLTDPHDPKDKYRFEADLPGGGSLFYLTDPDEPIKDKVIICEGAKKALVTWFWLDMGQHTVLGAASANTVGPALEATKDCGERILILDPGAEKTSWKLARQHKGLKILSLSSKIDDAYLKYGLDREGFAQLLTQARVM